MNELKQQIKSINNIEEFKDELNNGNFIFTSYKYFERNISANNITLYNEILSATDFLPISVPFKEKLYCITNNISRAVICTVCNKNPVKFNGKKYLSTRCHRCTLSSEEHITKMLDKYGCVSPNSSPIVKQHKIESLLKNHGVTNSFQIPEVIEAGKLKRIIEHNDPN